MSISRHRRRWWNPSREPSQGGDTGSNPVGTTKIQSPGADALAALGAPASIKHTGRVLHEVVGTEGVIRAGDQVEFDDTSGAEPSVIDTEADEVEHLRGLG